MEKNIPSQNKQIANYLKRGATITSLEALKLFGCLRLSGRIYDLKKQGFDIQARTITTLEGKRVSEYYIKFN